MIYYLLFFLTLDEIVCDALDYKFWAVLPVFIYSFYLRVHSKLICLKADNVIIVWFLSLKQISYSEVIDIEVLPLFLEVKKVVIKTKKKKHLRIFVFIEDEIEVP